METNASVPDVLVSCLPILHLYADDVSDRVLQDLVEQNTLSVNILTFLQLARHVDNFSLSIHEG